MKLSPRLQDLVIIPNESFGLFGINVFQKMRTKNMIHAAFREGKRFQAIVKHKRRLTPGLCEIINLFSVTLIHEGPQKWRKWLQLENQMVLKIYEIFQYQRTGRHINPNLSFGILLE